MIKRLLGSAALVSLLIVAPASAQMGMGMECNKENMDKMNSDMSKMPAGEKRTMAMKEMGMAKEMMDKKDMAGCKASMDKMSVMMTDMSKENKPVDGMKK